MISNATGCSSIYGGNLPTTPYTKRADGRGPTWINSLFEDNAEVAYGMRCTVDKFTEYAKEVAKKIIDSPKAGKDLKDSLAAILGADQSTQELIEEHKKAMRQIVEEYRNAIRQIVEEEKEEIWKRAETLKNSMLKLGL